MVTKMNNRFEKIERDFSTINPLALPQYLIDCEFYDMQDAQHVLEQAVEEFENQGGVAGNICDTLLHAASNSVIMVLLKKIHKPTYQKAVKGKIDFSEIIKQTLTFTYPPENKGEETNNTPEHDILVKGQHDCLRRDVSDVSQKYKTSEYRDLSENNANSRFKAKVFSDSKAAEDITGRTVYDSKDAPKNSKGNPDRNYVGEADHIKPLQMIHKEHGAFIRRYSDQKTINNLVNSEKNFQLLAGDINAAKGGAKTNAQFIAYCDNIQCATDYKKQLANKDISSKQKQDLQNKIKDLNLSPTQKKASSSFAEYDKLSPAEKKKLEKYQLTEKGKKELLKKQAEAEAFLKKQLLKDGSVTVLIEQIGRIVTTVVGPVAYELKDIVKNGITYGLDTNNVIEAFIQRIWRILKYVIRELPKLIGEMLGDLSQMLLTFLVSASKIVKDFFGKFFEIALSGISIIIESVKVLMNPKMDMRAKGDAVSKIIISFITGILGNFLIDLGLNALGLPDPFSEIVAVLASSFVSAVAVYYFSKLDVFNIKREVRMQRIKELFELRVERIKKDTSQFNLLVSEKLKQQRLKFEKIKFSFDQALESDDMGLINNAIDDFAEMFQVDIPYSSTEEFVDYIRSKDQILIA